MGNHAPAGIRTRVADSKGRHTLDTLGLTGLYALTDSILPGLVTLSFATK